MDEQVRDEEDRIFRFFPDGNLDDRTILPDKNAVDSQGQCDPLVFLMPP